MKRKPKPRKTSPEHRALLRLLKVNRGLIEEIGHLRRMLLEMRPKPELPTLPEGMFWVYEEPKHTDGHGNDITHIANGEPK